MSNEIVVVNNRRFNLSTLIIIALSLWITYSYLFKKSDVTTYKDKIDLIELENNKLNRVNDSLVIKMSEVNKEIEIKKESIRLLSEEASKYDNRIKKLEYEKKETTNYVNSLNDDGVSREFTKYLKSKG